MRTRDIYVFGRSYPELCLNPYWPWKLIIDKTELTCRTEAPPTYRPTHTTSFATLTVLATNLENHRGLDLNPDPTLCAQQFGVIIA